MDINIIELTDQGKDFSPVASEDVVILPAFGASYSEMKLLNDRRVQIVDTTCPWVRTGHTTLQCISPLCCEQNAWPMQSSAWHRSRGTAKAH